MRSDTETIKEQELERSESQATRENAAVERLNEAERRKIEKDRQAGRDPLSIDDSEIDRASDTWHGLAASVSLPDLPEPSPS